MNKTIYPACFFTATNLSCKHLLASDKHKQIIMNSLLFLKKNKRVIIYAFVIMANHIHLIWQPTGVHTPKQNQHNFLKYTAQMIKFNLLNSDLVLLSDYRVNAIDREFQFWERNSLSIELYSEKVFIQKLNYIHNNPVKAGLCTYPEDYAYSSALYYETGKDVWGGINAL